MEPTRAEYKPFITVGLATRNGSDTLVDCVESVLGNSYQNREVIVVDDGSRDDSPALLSRFPITVVHQSARGISAGRNSILRLAQGELIIYTDSDTIVSPDWLDQMVPHLSDPRVGAVCGRTAFRTDHRCTSWIKSLENEIRMRGRAQDTSMVVGLNCAFRKEVLDQVRGFDADWFHAEDTEISYLVARAGYRILYAPDALVEHVAEGAWRNYLWKRYRNAKAHMRVLFKYPRRLAADDFVGTRQIKIQAVLGVLSCGGLSLGILAAMLSTAIPALWPAAAATALAGILGVFVSVLSQAGLVANVYRRSGRLDFLVKTPLILACKTIVFGAGAFAGLIHNLELVPRFLMSWVRREPRAPRPHPS